MATRQRGTYPEGVSSIASLCLHLQNEASSSAGAEVRQQSKKLENLLFCSFSKAKQVKRTEDCDERFALEKELNAPVACWTGTRSRSYVQTERRDGDAAAGHLESSNIVSCY